MATGLAQMVPPLGSFLSEKLQALETELKAAAARRDVPGAVVWLERGGQHWEKAAGQRAVDPVAEPMTADTIFDAASLTKVMATAPSVLLLAEDGKLDLAAPASRWLPEFTGDGKENITLMQLLLHTSGLRPGLGGDRRWQGHEAGIQRAAAERIKTPAGTEFCYSDLNFILLGEIVRRAGGEPLDQFARRRLYEPLGMTETTFLPPAAKLPLIAPTTREKEGIVRGTVHDPTARRMGGVAGNAGLFTTARDAARYCRMLLNEGKNDRGHLVMKPETVRMLTTAVPGMPGGSRRTPGFDAELETSLKGAHFGPLSYGHTGWTGTGFWIDPASKSFFVLMTNRNHPTEAGAVSVLRWHVSTLGAEAMGVARPVLSGVDVVAKSGLKMLEGKKFGLVTNQTGLTSDGKTTASVLAKIPGARLTVLFSPEHGLQGKLDQAKIGDSRDEASGVPVVSLYGKTRRPTKESLAGVEVLVFDIQDIGCRFYTYISTMLECMTAAEEAGLPFVVLDRVNPVNGTRVEGPLPFDSKFSFTACHTIPIRHGLTAGELARLLAKERAPALQLTVVPLENWNRRFFFPRTLAPWRDPSPNMRSAEAALLYPGIGLLEFSNVSVGRGTKTPFSLVGAPWIDAAALVKRLKEAGTPGVLIEEAHFTPSASVFAGKQCHGIRLTVTDERAVRSVRLGLAVARALFEGHGETYQLDKVNTLLVHPPTLAAIRARRPLGEIIKLWAADEAAFAARRQEVLLYPESDS